MEEAQNPLTNVVELSVVPNADTQPILEVLGQCTDTNVGNINIEPMNQEEQVGKERAVEGG